MIKTFDLVAPFYVLLEKLSFGDSLNTARRAYIEAVLNAENTLLLGEGNGRFLCDCLRSKRGGSVTVLDSSPKMLELLATRVREIQHTTELKMVCADVFAWKPDGPAFDVVVTHFFLDLFQPPSQRRLIEKISDLSKPETLWIDVDYKPTNKTGIYRVIDWLQYRFDRLLSGVETDRHYDPAALLTELGWTAREERRLLDGAVLAHLLVKTSANS